MAESEQAGVSVCAGDHQPTWTCACQQFSLTNQTLCAQLCGGRPAVMKHTYTAWSLLSNGHRGRIDMLLL